MASSGDGSGSRAPPLGQAPHSTTTTSTTTVEEEEEGAAEERDSDSEAEGDTCSLDTLTQLQVAEVEDYLRKVRGETHTKDLLKKVVDGYKSTVVGLQPSVGGGEEDVVLDPVQLLAGEVTQATTERAERVSVVKDYDKHLYPDTPYRHPNPKYGQ